MQDFGAEKPYNDKPRAQTVWHPNVSPPSVNVTNIAHSYDLSYNSANKKKRTRSSGDAIRVPPPASPYKTSVFYNDNAFLLENNRNKNEMKMNEEVSREVADFLSLYESKMKKWESMGEWIEVRETLTGKVSWYNSLTTRLVFDTPPNVEILNVNLTSPMGAINGSKGGKNANIIDTEKEYYLNRSLFPMPNENIVASLLQFDNDIRGWNFDYNNLNVYNYRLSASKRDHTTMLAKPQQYVFPEYFSLAPLPELLANKFLAKIKLPKEFSKNKKYSLVQIKNDITKASDVIKAGVSKLDPPHDKQGNVGDFIIKIVGQEAYMYGKKHVIEYEAVRDALRNEDDVEFALIKRTDFAQTIKNAKQEQEAYINKIFPTAYDNILAGCLPTKRNTLSGPDNEHKNTNMDNMDDLMVQIDLPSNSISLYEFEWHYRLKIEGLTNVTSLPRFDPSIIKSVYMMAEIWCGGINLTQATLKTKHAIPAAHIRWGTWLSSQNLIFSQLPRESVLCLMVFGVIGNEIASKSASSKRSKMFGRRSKNMDSTFSDAGPDACLAWARLPIITDDNYLRKGKILLNMWHLPKKDTFNQLKHKPFRYRGSTCDRNIKVLDAEQCQLLIAFDEHPFDVIAPKYSTVLAYEDNRFSGTNNIRISNKNMNLAVDRNNMKGINKKQKNDIDSIIHKSPLNPLEIFEKQLVWSYRDNLWHRPEALSAFVRSCNWTNVVDIKEAHKYLDIWAAPKHYADAIEFLDYKYLDTKLREKAVSWLNEMDDSDLQKYLLQLVQCLKFEIHHENALSLFLLRRALLSPYQIGHYFFWYLKSEFDMFIEYVERFGLYLEEYLLFSCGHSKELFIQNAMLKRLEWISKKVTAIPEKKRFSQESKKFFKKELFKLNHDLSHSNKNKMFQIPLYPRWKSYGLKMNECKYMSSKKVPLWLVFENADKLGQDIVVLYKYGDDLRQDTLTLQIIRLMDNLWLNENIDLHLKPYRCLSTGNQAGMLEIVLNSKTVNNIAEVHGGVFDQGAIDNFIKQYNSSQSFCQKAKENFARSVAGYCIATYVLGISDRHSSNYMVCKNGQFFHIDFGHFLGNWKTKWGIKRERTPLVFTNQMRYAISNENETLYKDFINWCSASYNILRHKNRLLLILFRLMIAAQMEELVSENDIMYFQNQLNLSMDDKNATKHIEKAIDKALKDWGTYVNNKIHQIRHQKNK